MLVRVVPHMILLLYGGQSFQGASNDALKKLDSTDELVRTGAARELARTWPVSKEAVPVLVRHMGDSSPSVRNHVQKALVIAGTEAVAPLVDELRRTTGGRRYPIIETLGRIGRPARAV